MSSWCEMTADSTAARLVLQRVATHVLARARFAADGRFGLRVTADGIGTPAFGPDGDVLRIAGATLVHEHGGRGAVRTRTMAIAGHSLAELAAFAGVDLALPFTAGDATPGVGDPDLAISLSNEEAVELLSWFRLGLEAIDQVLPSLFEPSLAQLWPEHFDLGIDASTAQGRVNLGASPGDTSHPAPYFYVGPWEGARPGDPVFWNAPFGALLPRDAVVATVDPVDTAAAFLRRGVQLLS